MDQRETRRQRVDSWDSDELPVEQGRQILAARTAQLAEVPVAKAVGESVLLVPLRTGREFYAIDVQYVLDIRPLETLTRVPRVPTWVAGVTNLKGRIVSVIDLQQFLGAARPAPIGGAGAAPTPPAVPYLVVVETAAMEVALLVDEVLPLEEVQLSRIYVVTGGVQMVRPEYVRGLVDGDEGRVMVVLDLPALLSDERLIVRQEFSP